MEELEKEVEDLKLDPAIEIAIKILLIKANRIGFREAADMTLKAMKGKNG